MRGEEQATGEERRRRRCGTNLRIKNMQKEGPKWYSSGQERRKMRIMREIERETERERERDKGKEREIRKRKMRG
jgi:hypothetical protein